MKDISSLSMATKLRLLGRFADEMRKRGVIDDDFSRTLEESEQLDAIAAAMKTLGLRDKTSIAQRGELGKDIELEHLRTLLESCFTRSPRARYLIEFFCRDIPLFRKVFDQAELGPLGTKASIVMFFGVGATGKKHTPAEIAQALDRQPKTIKSNIHNKGLVQLRRELEDAVQAYEEQNETADALQQEFELSDKASEILRGFSINTKLALEVYSREYLERECGYVADDQAVTEVMDCFDKLHQV